MEFRLLGPVEVRAGGVLVPLGGVRQRALLALLLLHAGEVVSRDRLIDELWGERSADSAGHRLEVLVSRLRRTAGLAEVLVTRAGGYVLEVDAEDVDARRFERLLGQGRHANGDGKHELAATLLGAALSLWRGEALGDLAYLPFARVEAERLEELRLAAFEERTDARLALGEHVEVIGELDRMLAEHPTCERIAGQLMLALYRCERQADALEIYQRARARLVEELGLEPGPGLKAMQARILDQASSLQPSSETGHREGRPRIGDAEGDAREHDAPRSGGSLPALPTPTVGRQEEINDVCRLLKGPDGRLVTLTGPGGVGKTRVARLVAALMDSWFPEGVIWVDLGGVTRSDDVGPAIARALAVTPRPAESVDDAICSELGARALLFAIDNFEHVLEAADLLSKLHGACRRLRFLVTSREALNVACEQRVRVEPLAVPISESVSVAEIESTDATALFVSAARRRDSRFAVTAASAPAIARICARLDGLPLALELAAAQTEILGVEELEARLEELGGLGRGPRDAPARQHTLRATIEWSYRLLDGEQRVAFCGFAVFAGGATVDAAQAVTGASIETIEDLAAKSLIDRIEQRDGTTRLVMLETVRRYALERLARRSMERSVREAHTAFYLRLIEQAASRLFTRDEHAALTAIDGEIDNVHAALQWALQSAPVSALRLAGHLGEHLGLRGDPVALPLIDAALDAVGDRAAVEHRARAHLRRGQLLTMRERFKEGIAAYQQAVALYDELGDEAGISTALGGVGQVALNLGDVELARTSAEAAYRHARIAGDDRLVAGALAQVANLRPPAQRNGMLEHAAELLTKAGDYRGLSRVHLNAAYMALIENRIAEAMRLLELALPATERAGNPVGMMFVLGNLGLAHLFSDDLERARDAFEQQLRLCRGRSFRYGVDEGLAGLAAVCARDGRPDQAARLLGAAHGMGYPPTGDQPIYRRLQSDYFAPARARYGSSAWHRNEQAGAELGYEGAIAYALRTSSHDKLPEDEPRRLQSVG